MLVPEVVGGALHADLEAGYAAGMHGMAMRVGLPRHLQARPPPVPREGLVEIEPVCLA